MTKRPDSWHHVHAAKAGRGAIGNRLKAIERVEIGGRY